jgi:isopentenyldiphosphate isomerase
MNTSFSNNPLVVEILDVVDDNDNVLSKLTRQEIYANGMSNFRVINCFLWKVEVDGKEPLIWVPRRHPQKKLFPLHLDTSVGGHVQSGETYIEAFKRECLEEININIEDYEYKSLFHLNPVDHSVSAFMTVYGLRWNSSLSQDPSFNLEDFIECFWMKPEELYEILRANKEKAKSDLVILVAHLIEYMKSNRLEGASARL